MATLEGKYVLAAFGIIILVIIVTALNQQPAPPPTTPTTVKVQAICGNSVCDEGESSFNCCNDCPCAAGERCNDIKQRCEIAFALSAQEATTIVSDYLQQNGYTNYDIDVGSVSDHQGEEVILVYAYTPESRLFAVTENGRVSEISLSD